VNTSNTDAPFLPLPETRNTGGVSVTTPFDCDESAGSTLRYPSASTDAPIDDSWSCRNLQSISGSRSDQDQRYARSGRIHASSPTVHCHYNAGTIKGQSVAQVTPLCHARRNRRIT
jgi:hypothetical protein